MWREGPPRNKLGVKMEKQNPDDEKIRTATTFGALFRILLPAGIIVTFTEMHIRDAILISLLVDYVRMIVDVQMDHLWAARALANLAEAKTTLATNLSRLIELMQLRIGHDVPETEPRTES